MNPRIAALATALLLGCGPVWAYDGFTSEISHATAGAAMAVAGTAIASYFELEHRGWIGFGASASLGILSEVIQISANPGTSLRSSALDAGSNMLGAAVGAWGTHRFILKPVVAKDVSGHRVAGVAVQAEF